MRDRGIGAGVAHPVDVRGGEVKARRRPEDAVDGGPSIAQALLAHRAAQDRDRASGDVVVVEAGVVIVHPADQPGGQVLVAEQLLIDALRGVVLDEVDPQLGASASSSTKLSSSAPERSRPRGRGNTKQGGAARAAGRPRRGGGTEGRAALIGRPSAG